MDLHGQDERHLLHALSLATAAAAFASPNPTVGCVIADAAGRVAGEGAHHYDERDHAEIVALKQAHANNAEVRGATAYVTLEPCSHRGRTGPCADALIAAGIARVVVATVDPNPQVSGRGIAKLKDAGVRVEVLDPSSSIAQQARRLNDAFAFSIVHERPFITLKAALSVDGKLAPPPATRQGTAPFWVTGTVARADVQHLRHDSDAVMTGVGTVLADDPLLTDRTGLPRRRKLLRVVLDSLLRTPPDSQLVKTCSDDVLMICSDRVDQGRVALLEASGVQVHAAPEHDGRLDLHAALRLLHERSVRSVLLEAGSALNAGFLAAQLVDKVVLYYAECEFGGQGVPLAADLLSHVSLEQQLKGVQRVSFPNAAPGRSEDVRITGYLRDPWAAS